MSDTAWGLNRHERRARIKAWGLDRKDRGRKVHSCTVDAVPTHRDTQLQVLAQEILWQQKNERIA